MDESAVQSSPVVRLENRAGVAEAVLHRPPHNILDTESLLSLAAALRRAGADPDVRVVVLRSEGKHFSAGVEVGDHVGAKAPRMLTAFRSAILALWECPLPTLAVVQGAAMGGGLELALAADLTLVAADARLGQPEVHVGVFPPAAVALLPAAIGPKNALDLLLTGRTLSGEEAFRLGLAQRVRPADRLLDEARALARALSELSRPVLAACKKAARLGEERPFPEALALAERVYESELMATQDAHAGLSAFLERRKPVWQHK